MSDSEKEPKLEEGGIFIRDLVEGGNNPDLKIMKDVFDVRAQIRNRFRVPILETTDLFFRKIPKVSSTHIMIEEEERLLSRARRNLRMGIFADLRGAYGEALCFRARKNETEDLYNEEYGKYVAGKIVRKWRDDGAEAALSSFREIVGRQFLNEDKKKSVKEESVFIIKSRIFRWIQDGNYGSAVEGMMKFAEICSFSRGEFCDLGITEKEESGLLEYLEAYLAGLLDKNPGIFSAVKHFFIKMEIKGAKQLHLSEAVRNVARNKLIEAAGMSICYLTEAIEVYDDLKIVDGEEVKQWPEILAQLERRLSEAMSVGWAAFMKVRDYIVENGLITAEDAGNMPLVVQADKKKYSLEPLSICSVDSVMQDVIKINNFLEKDNQHELNVFNEVRHLYCLELANFLRAYPYFQKMFKDFNPGEYLAD